MKDDIIDRVAAALDPFFGVGTAITSSIFGSRQERDRKHNEKVQQRIDTLRKKQNLLQLDNDNLQQGVTNRSTLASRSHDNKLKAKMNENSKQIDDIESLANKEERNLR